MLKTAILIPPSIYLGESNSAQCFLFTKSSYYRNVICLNETWWSITSADMSDIEVIISCGEFLQRIGSNTNNTYLSAAYCLCILNVIEEIHLCDYTTVSYRQKRKCGFTVFCNPGIMDRCFNSKSENVSIWKDATTN